MSSAQSRCASSVSTESPMILTLRRSNSGFSRAASASSVVHTGVKSLGCENSTPQLVPSQAWNAISPRLEAWVKSGARSPNWMVIGGLLDVARDEDEGEVRGHFHIINT